jgi:hypothetical protein
VRQARSVTHTQRPDPAPAMSDEEREAVRKAGAEDARRSRVAQGLPERIEDPAAIAVLAAILRSPRQRAPPRERTIPYKRFGSCERPVRVGGSE